MFLGPTIPSWSYTSYWVLQVLLGPTLHCNWHETFLKNAISSDCKELLVMRDLICFKIYQEKKFIKPLITVG